MRLLGTVAADEVSPVKRGANRRRTILKGDEVEDADAQVQDILAVPWEHEGAMLDGIRKNAETDEVVEKAALAGMRLLNGIAEDLPEPMQEAIAKLGQEMYSLENPTLNSGPGRHFSGELTGSTNGLPDSATASGDATEVTVSGPAKDGTGSGAKVAAEAEDEDEVAKADYDEECEKADRTFSASERRRMAGNGQAMSDGSFPIPDKDALRRAKASIGRTNPSKRSKVRAHINARAKALGEPGIGQEVSKESAVQKALRVIGEALGVEKATTPPATPEDPAEGQEPGVAVPFVENNGGGYDDPSATDDNVNKEEGTVGIPVPIQKEDGTWDLSGVPEEARPFYSSMIEKQDSLAAENAKLVERVQKADEQALESRVQKAAEGFSKLAPTEDVAEILKAAATTMTHEQYEKLESVLKAGNDRVVAGDLFREAGRTYGGAAILESAGDAWAKIEKAADELVAKGAGDLSQAQAVDRILKTREGAALYEQYLAENGMGVTA